MLVAYRLLGPGSEWRLHREWFQRSALADLLGEDAGLAEIHKLYRCHHRLLVHEQAVFARGRPAVTLSGGDAEGPPDAPGEASHRSAVAAGATGRAGEALGATRRALRSGAKPRSRRQGAGNAAAPVEAVVGAAQATVDDAADA